MRTNRNPKSPWNPAKSLEISPEDYEKQVVEWLKRCDSAQLKGFEVKHRKKVQGLSGNYEIDAVAEFTIFGGASFKVLVECKRYSSPVERDIVLTFSEKIRDVGAHKGMMFATSGFQSGALDYAEKHGIATITFVEGNFTYETKSVDGNFDPPPWADIPDYCGLFLRKADDRIYTSVISNNRLDEMSQWLKNGV